MTEEALKKLVNVLGQERANRVVADTMQRAKLSALTTPQERYRFACELMTQGGILEAVGRALKIQAILHGARDA